MHSHYSLSHSAPPPPGAHTGGVCTGGFGHSVGPQANQAHSGCRVDLQSDYTGTRMYVCHVCVLKGVRACAVENFEFLSLSVHIVYGGFHRAALYIYCNARMYMYLLYAFESHYTYMHTCMNDIQYV